MFGFWIEHGSFMRTILALTALLGLARATSGCSGLGFGTASDRRGCPPEDKGAAGSCAGGGTSMRAIFLDVDGVLLPFGEQAAANSEGNFTPESLEALREIIRGSGENTKIVLSSTWRCAGGAIAALEQFTRFSTGPDDPLACIARDGEFWSTTCPQTHLHRQWEIAKWLEVRSQGRAAPPRARDSPVFSCVSLGRRRASRGASSGGWLSTTKSSSPHSQRMEQGTSTAGRVASCTVGYFPLARPYARNRSAVCLTQPREHQVRRALRGTAHQDPEPHRTCASTHPCCTCGSTTPVAVPSRKLGWLLRGGAGAARQQVSEREG